MKGALPWLFVVLMLGLTGVFVTLGIWQVNRLAEKDALVATVAERQALPPLALPPLPEWVGFDPVAYDYRQVAATGAFLPDQTVLVFTSLSEPRGLYAGPGYWVMTPLALTGGGIVFVNRGFVPQQLAATYTANGGAVLGQVTVTGIARVAEEPTAFTPGADRQNRIEWVRDPERLAVFLDPARDLALGPVAGITIDLPAGEPGALPQGGETTMSFPNNHLGYALTWFGFALLTPILLAVWLVRQRKQARAP